MNFYYSKSEIGWYHKGTAPCSVCEVTIKRYGFAIIKHPRKFKSDSGVLCTTCVRNEKDKYPHVLDAIEFRQVNITNNLPVDAVLSPIRKITLGSNVSVFDAAVSNKGIKSDTSATVEKDHTVLAGRESIEGAQVGISPEESDDKCLKDEAVDDFLSWSKNPNSQVTDDKKKKQIGDDADAKRL